MRFALINLFTPEAVLAEHWVWDYSRLIVLRLINHSNRNLWTLFVYTLRVRLLGRTASPIGSAHYS